MKLLYIDTVTDTMVTGIFEVKKDGINTLTISEEEVAREGGVRLPNRIREHLGKVGIQKPDAILVVSGPGSFTGIRIGLSFAKTYAQALEIPINSTISLEVYTRYYFQKHKKRSIVLLDGRMKKVYGSAYSEAGFEPVVDLPYGEAESSLRIGGSLLFTNFPSANGIPIYRDFPLPEAYLDSEKDNLLKMNIKEHNWKMINPQYFRGTYADKE